MLIPSLLVPLNLKTTTLHLLRLLKTILVLIVIAVSLIEHVSLTAEREAIVCRKVLLHRLHLRMQLRDLVRGGEECVVLHLHRILERQRVEALAVRLGHHVTRLQVLLHLDDLLR